MNCQKFESHLESFLSGRLPSTSMQECRTHLESCAACSELLDLMENQFIRDEAPHAEELVQAVLGKTTGKSCNQAHEWLPDHVDGLLPGARRALLEQHLEHCPRCQQIHQTLRELKEQLPRLAEMDPGRSFPWRVMQATRQLDHLTPRERFRFNQIWHRLVYRPRLAWEAAYALTLLLVALSRVLTFIAGWPSVESISSLQVKSAQVWKSTASSVKENWAHCSFSLAAKQDRWISASSESKNEFWKKMTSMVHQIRQYWKSTSIAVIQMQNSIWNGIAGQINDIWPKGGLESQRLSPKKEMN